MKKFEVKYQEGNNILIATVEAPNSLSARYQFYMLHATAVDILEVKEVANDTV